MPKLPLLSRYHPELPLVLTLEIQLSMLPSAEQIPPHHRVAVYARCGKGCGNE